MTEICVQVNADYETVRNAFVNMGFVHKESYENRDAYFTFIPKNEIMDTEYKTLLEKSLLVRNVVGENSNTKKVVYKRKKLDNQGNVVSEEKESFNIDNIDSAKKVFHNLGMTCWCDFVVCNNEFQRGEIVLNIQTVKDLGVFVEIEEYKAISNKNNEQKFKILVDIVKSIGLPLGNDFSCKKPFMFYKQNIKSIK